MLSDLAELSIALAKVCVTGVGAAMLIAIASRLLGLNGSRPIKLKIDLEF
jgi:hypothetical protein